MSMDYHGRLCIYIYILHRNLGKFLTFRSPREKKIWNFYQSQLNILRLSSMPEQSTPTLPKSCKRTIEILLLHSTLSCLIPEDKSYAIPNTEPKIDREPKKNKASGRLKFVVPKTPTKQQKKSNPKSSSFSHPISNTGTEINKLSSES